MHKRAETFSVPEITFIGEQDGAVEAELKVCLVARFRSNAHVNQAYLVRVRYGDAPEVKVALCLEAGDKIQPQIVDAAGCEFRKIFNSDASMDILFLSPEQHARISSVAQPFYRRQA
jgi:hypothetical protein